MQLSIQVQNMRCLPFDSCFFLVCPGHCTANHLHTVDGKNPETGMVNIPFLQGFIHVRWCRMSSINSIYQASQEFFLE